MNIRLTSAALGFYIGICISSGFSPALATWLVKLSPFAPGFIFTVFAVLGLLGMYISTKVKRVEEEADEDDKITIIDDDLSAHLL